jgi:hypothetical protein
MAITLQHQLFGRPVEIAAVEAFTIRGPGLHPSSPGTGQGSRIAGGWGTEQAGRLRDTPAAAGRGYRMPDIVSSNRKGSRPKHQRGALRARLAINTAANRVVKRYLLEFLQ